MNDKNATADNEKKIVIHIDRSEFKVASKSLTGAEIRALPTPAIGQDRDLYLEVPGPGNDLLIEDAQRVELKNGMQFFTTPRVITPGA